MFNRVGNRYGRLVVLAFSHRKGNAYMWSCRCDCGKERVVEGKALGKATFSCGCLSREQSVARGKARRIHGLSHAPEYAVWRTMNARCADPKTRSFRYYGGRGIQVCEHWRLVLGSNLEFRQWFADMGPRPSAEHSMDRRDNELGYLCPTCHPPSGNVRWATVDVQARNRRLRKLTKDDIVAIRQIAGTNKQLAVRFGVNPSTISRIKSGLRCSHI